MPCRRTISILLFRFYFFRLSPVNAIEPSLEENNSNNDALRTQCLNSVVAHDPPCKHGTVPFSLNSTHPENCAHCVERNEKKEDNGTNSCPIGWTGVDCSVCTQADVCPKVTANGKTYEPVGCSSTCLLVTKEELSSGITKMKPEAYPNGKVFSCKCGGDAKTDPYCRFQKDLSIIFHISNDYDFNLGKKQNLKISARAYGGMPTMDNPSYPVWKYRYASPAIWDANFTKCSYDLETCKTSGIACVSYKCLGGQVSCPPSDVEPCPGRTAMGCGTNVTDLNSNTSYWQHPCSPLATPKSKRGLHLFCDLNQTQTADGKLVCHLNQPGVIPTLAVTCSVGNCLYSSETLKSQDWCSFEKSSAVNWTNDLMTRAFMLFFVISFMAVILVYILFRHLQKYVENSDYFEEGEVHDSLLFNSTVSMTDVHFAAEDEIDNNLSGIFEQLTTSMQSSRSRSLDSESLKVLSWRHLYVETRIKKPFLANKFKASFETKLILNDVSGMAGPGGVFAVLGPSGAGKSTLIDTLSGRALKTKTSKGACFINGKAMSSVELLTASAYMTQEDVLPGLSTVWEHLLFHAFLRISNASQKPESIKQRVSKILSKLGIEKLKDSLIGDQFSRGISGGEKRMVSIATELLVFPGIMFLDEPTTGLDSTNAARVVDILNALGNSGVTVLLSIHQPRPDIFRMLDRILLLSSTGTVVFSGTSMQAEPFFDSLSFIDSKPSGVHIADFMLDVVIKSKAKTVSRISKEFAVSEVQIANKCIVEFFKHEFEGDTLLETRVKNKSMKYECSKLEQVEQLTQRLVRNTCRHPFIVIIHFIATLFIAIALGVIFFRLKRDTGGIQNRMGCMFFIILFLTLMALSSLPVWREERLLYTRERMTGAYGSEAYFLSVMFNVVILRTIPPLFFCITYLLVGFRRNFIVFISFMLVCMLTNVCAALTCICISIISPSNASANVCGLLLLLVNILCGGFLLGEEQLKKGGNMITVALTEFSFVHHAFNAMMIGQFESAGTFYFTPKLSESRTYANSDEIRVPVSGEEVLDFFGFGTERAEMWDHVIVLLGITLGYAILVYILIRVRNRN